MFCAAPRISIIVTAHNEGEELACTLRSIVDNTQYLEEVIVVDDGSDDDSCATVGSDIVRVIRHEQRIGVASSRDEGSRAARGNVLGYLDGHQRVGRYCLDRCAQVALERNAITCPDVRDYGLLTWRLHGANCRLCPNRGWLSASWRTRMSLRRVSPVTGLCAPPYLIPRALYRSVAWSHLLRGWGASEASVYLKAFFQGIDILHVAGPVARHRFRPSSSPFRITWEEVWRNHAVIIRTCFDDATWFGYWLPRVFESHLTQETIDWIEGPDAQAEHRRFLSTKLRTDRQFWSDLLGHVPPTGICFYS